jgi:hypothetical protein
MDSHIRALPGRIGAGLMRNDLAEDLVWGLSLSNLLSIRLWAELQVVHDWKYASYCWTGGARRTLDLATLADVVVAGLLFFAVLRVARWLPVRVAAEARPWIRLVGCAALVARLSEPATLSALFGASRAEPVFEALRAWLDSAGSRGRILLSVVVAAVGAGIVAYLVLRRLRLLFSASRVAILVLSPLVAFNFGQSAWYIRSSPPAAHETRAAAVPRDPRPGSPRILWLIFDELDQHLAFEDRPAGIPMPQFDRLRSESLYAEDAVPPAEFTGDSLPALITGEPVVANEPWGPDELKLILSGGKTAAWSKQPNVFGDASALGLQSGIVGWFHPYCRVLGGSVSACHQETSSVWLGDSFALQAYAESIGFRRTLAIQVSRTLFSAPQHKMFDGRQVPTYEQEYWRMIRAEHQRCFRAIRKAALEFATRPELSLLLVHPPIPHPPGIYDRETHRYLLAARSDYLDNLVLADHFLGEIRGELEARGLWDGTTVLVTADHPYRVGTWAPSPVWTAEMAREVAGHELKKIVFLLKLPGQHREVPCGVHFNSIITRPLFQAIMRGQIHSPEEAARWLTEHPGRA